MRFSNELGREFGDLFAKYERALKRGGFLKSGREDAQADWRAFATALGSKFFDEVRTKNLAPTLIAKPPGKLMRADLSWNRPGRPLQGSVELFERGVCRVRNNFFHGEKFVGNADEIERDIILIAEAVAVLLAAKGKIPAVARLIG